MSLDGTEDQASRDPSGNSASEPAPRDEHPSLQKRLITKEKWKSQPGHRYTPEELERMSEAAEVKIHRRKRITMRI